MKRSEQVTVAIDKIWKSYDKKQMWEGFELLRQASEASDADASCFLGRCYMGEGFVWDGAGFPVDEDEASRLIKESVLGGSADGVLCAMRTGNLSPEVQENMPFDSLKEAFMIVKQRARKGDAFSQYQVGNVMFYGDIIDIEGPDESDKYDSAEEYYEYAYPIAAKYYEKSFRNGLAAAFGNYRTIYESDLTDIDSDRYEMFMKLLVDSGDPLTCNDYGKWLHDEYGDAEEAFRYYLMALERGDIQAAYNVGICYEYGEGVESDIDKAFEYYMSAAQAGNYKSQFMVGDFYFEGRGSVEQDYTKAVYWLDKSYNGMDDDNAWKPAAELAVCYHKGLGVCQDDDTAFGLLSRLDQDDMIDQVWDPLGGCLLNALGEAYGFGRGVAQDIAKAIRYFDMAIERGSKEAEQNKSRFKKTLFGRWKMR